MGKVLKAVIFDMDGVLINSEHLWRRAMVIGFKQCLMPVTEEQCRTTMGMRFREVIRIWLDHFNVKEFDEIMVEEVVMKLLLDMIASEGTFIPGIPEIIAYCKDQGLKMGIATSSSELLMNAVIKKLDINSSIDAAVSAQHLKYGKPHPEVFLLCAEKLAVPPAQCFVIEDSLNGVIAARAAQMPVVAVPDDEHSPMLQFSVADYKCADMMEVLALLKRLK